MGPQGPLLAASPPTTLSTSHLATSHAPSALPTALLQFTQRHPAPPTNDMHMQRDSWGSTAKGIMIGIFSVLGVAGLCLIIAVIVFYFRYTQQGRIFLDRITRPGEYDDEQQFAKEEAEALEAMDDIQRTEYLRAKGNALCTVVHAGAKEPSANSA